MKVLITGAGRGIGAAIAEAVAGGWSGAQLGALCREAGMDSFVAKPVNIEMLRAVLEQYCQASAST